ncbi:MAG TPA: RnfABCDGE type electron transport complex subunit D [Clostridiaceae bacterium]|nr:RnfABCDGE type electron transport complex subunit D [Clostridiaceae bacterium]
MLRVSASPHIRSPRTTRAIMLDVIIALIPAMFAAFFIFGPRSLAIIAVSVAASVLTEALCNLAMKRDQSIGDLTAVVTGLLLAYGLPASLPLWMAALGAIVAIGAAKMLFGGLGDNFANPAITGRIFLAVSFGSSMSNSVVLGRVAKTGLSPDLIGQATALTNAGDMDLVSQATPLAVAREMVEGDIPDSLTLFLGNHAGMIGEVSVLALLIGALWLLLRGVIDLWIPSTMIVSTVLLCWVAGGDPLMHLMSGGLIIGAFFMATDYVTSPITAKGKIIFGIGCGLLTFLMRMYSGMPEGVSFAILIMNILTPHINNWTKPVTMGGEAHAS